MLDFVFLALGLGLFAAAWAYTLVAERLVMSLDLWLGGLLALGLFGYLAYALARPDRF